MKKEFSYTLKKSKRAKRMRLTVHADGSVVLTAPFFVSRLIIDRFVSEKRHWVIDKINIANSVMKKPVRAFSRSDYLKYKPTALALVQERVNHYNKIYNHEFNKIFIKNQKTRWGSCSNKKNINLNYKIMFLPQELRNYIVVHEICHLKEMNHSQNFWNLVSQTFPNHKQHRKQLRKHVIL